VTSVHLPSNSRFLEDSNPFAFDHDVREAHSLRQERHGLFEIDICEDDLGSAWPSFKERSTCSQAVLVEDRRFPPIRDHLAIVRDERIAAVHDCLQFRLREIRADRLLSGVDRQ
jgi:hypothetical protein